MKILDETLETYLWTKSRTFNFWIYKHRFSHWRWLGEKKKLASLLMMYKLLCTVNFATRTQNDSCSAIDSIFMGNFKLKL